MAPCQQPPPAHVPSFCHYARVSTLTLQVTLTMTTAPSEKEWIWLFYTLLALVRCKLRTCYIYTILNLYAGLQSVASSIVLWQYYTPGMPRTYIRHTYIQMERLLLWLSFVNIASLKCKLQ